MVTNLILSRRGGQALLGILIAWLILVPLVTSNAFTFRMSGVLIMILYATSFNLLLGGTGLLSFGQGAYFGLGAYGIGLTLRAEFGLASSLVITLVIATIAAGVIGFIALRATGVYFAFLTLSLGVVFYLLSIRFRGFTGGSDGLPGIRLPPVRVGPVALSFTGVQSYFYLTLFVVGLSVGILYVVNRSSVGYVLRSIREDQSRTGFLGLHVRRHQLLAFVIAGFFAAVAGALHAPLNGIATPALFWWVFSALPIVMTLLGGVNSFWGPVVGAMAFEAFRYFTAGTIRGLNIYLGAMIIIVVVVFPSGIVGVFEQVRARLLATLRPDELEGSNQVVAPEGRNLAASQEE